VQQAADPKSDGELVACLAAAAVQHWLQQDKEKHTTAPKNKEGKASLSLAPADGPGADGAGSKKSAPGKYAAVESSAATGAKGSAASDARLQHQSLQCGGEVDGSDPQPPAKRTRQAPSRLNL